MLIALIGYVCSYIVVLCIRSCVKELNLPNATVGNTDSDNNTDSDDNTDGDESESDILNIADSDGHTALHLACLNGHFQLSVILAHVMLTWKHGMSVLCQ